MALPASTRRCAEAGTDAIFVFRHPPAYTALEQAQASHIAAGAPPRWSSASLTTSRSRPSSPHTTGWIWNGCASWPARSRFGSRCEEEIAAIYPEFEVGATPPVGTIYGHRVFVEECFVGEPEMVFDAGTHTVSVCMHFFDFADMVKPMVGTFGIRPGRPRSATRRPIAFE